jgi:hypothetical protein
MLLIMLKYFNKVPKHFNIYKYKLSPVFTRPPFLFFQHNQQYDTLLPIPPPPPYTQKLKVGIAYWEAPVADTDGKVLPTAELSLLVWLKGSRVFPYFLEVSSTFGNDHMTFLQS